MIFYYIRHGDPIYEPDSLTPLGIEQAKALSKRFTLHGLDEIYCSPSNRAIQTAQPTYDLLKKEMSILDWTDERYAWGEFTIKLPNKRPWVYQDLRYIELFRSKELLDLGNDWINHELLLNTSIKSGLERIRKETDNFFLSLGFEHDRENARYKVLKPNEKKVALFAHQGFGLAFLSCLLDIPYNVFCTSFELGHSAITVINFDDKNEFCYPKVLQLSNDSHLYKENILCPYLNIFNI